MDNLLLDVRNYLDVTWEDKELDKKLTGILNRGISYINHAGGEEFDYTKENKPRELLFDYVRYVQSNALDEFEKNYFSEILKLQIDKELGRYDKKQPEVL